MTRIQNRNDIYNRAIPTFFVTTWVSDKWIIFFFEWWDTTQGRNALKTHLWMSCHSDDMCNT